MTHRGQCRGNGLAPRLPLYAMFLILLRGIFLVRSGNRFASGNRLWLTIAVKKRAFWNLGGGGLQTGEQHRCSLNIGYCGQFSGGDRMIGLTLLMRWCNDLTV